MKITFSRLPIYLQFIVLLVSIIPALWGFIAYDLNRLWTLTDANNRKQVENLAQIFSEQVNASIHAIDYALIELREKWDEDPVGFASVVRRRQQYLEKNVGFQVAILDKNGLLEFSSADPNARGSSFHDREHFLVHQMHRQDQLFISKPLLGRVSKRWTIQFTRPIHDQNGNFKGVIVLSVAPEHFSSLQHTFDLGNRSVTLLTREAGEILSRYPNPNIALGKTLDVQLLTNIRSSTFGLYEGSVGPDEANRLYAWRHIAGEPLVVLVGLAQGPLLAGYRAQQHAYLIIGIILSILWAVIAYTLLAAYRRRQQQECALRESHDRLANEQQRMQVILENSHDAFVAVDPQGRLTDWNSKAESIFGWARSEVIGKDVSELIIPEDYRAAHRAGFARFAASGKGTLVNNVVELEALHRNGHRIPVELAIAGYHHQEGFAVTAFIRDISIRKAAQREEAERMRSLEEARQALQHAQKLEAVGKLTGGVAHDFNNVLQIIGGNLEMLQMLLHGNEPLKARVESALRAVDRGAKLSSQLLSFARRQPLKPVVTDLQRILAGMSDLMQHAVGEDVTIKTTAPVRRWNVRVDPSQLENVILNLVLNSRDAMGRQGTITIRLENVTMSENDLAGHPELKAGSYVLLVVSDNGAGMSTEVRERAFEPFYSTKPSGEGTGLGLSMAYGFVKQSGGHIELLSAPGQGTDVRIYLPRSMEAPAQAARESDIDESVGGEETIVVAEDDPDVRETAVAMLCKLGYQVHQACDGESALDLMRTLPEVDLLFADVIMPGAVRGNELARRAQEIVPNVTVLFTSGYTENALGKEGMLGPDVHLLNKPYTREQLANIIRSLLYRKSIQST